MQRSDVFENFIKIAQDKGLISEEPKDKRARQSKTDPASVAKLYGVKPESPKDAQYKKNIIERAHPDSVVISPSYDKLNGLVENENERQNITLNILNRQTNGNLTNKKYAEKELVLSLVSLGNHLDNIDNDQLRLLTDACLLQTASIKKQALGQVAIIGLLAASAGVVVGLLYLHQHMDFANEGFVANTRKVIEEVDHLLDSNSNLGVGYEYNHQFLNTMKLFKQKIAAFANEYNNILPIINSLDMPRTGNELKQLAARPETTGVINAYKAFRDSAEDFIPFISKVVQDFSSPEYKNRAIKEKGIITSLIDKTKIMHGGKGLIVDDFDDVVHAIGPYKESISELINKLRTADSLEASATKQIQAAQIESSHTYGDPKVETKPVGSNTPHSPEDDLRDLDKGLRQGV